MTAAILKYIERIESSNGALERAKVFVIGVALCVVTLHTLPMALMSFASVELSLVRRNHILANAAEVLNSISYVV